jgi:anti-anti-sigma factor
MTIRLIHEPPTIAIVVDGALDAETIGAFRPAADAALNGTGPVVLRLDGVTALDSSGIAAIVFLHRRLSLSRRALRLTGLAGQPLALARLIGLDQAIPCDLPAAAPRPAPRLGLLAKLVAALRLAPAQRAAA